MAKTYSGEEKLAMMEAHVEACKNAPKRPFPQNKTCLSYWFPKIEAAGLPVPKTRIIETGTDWKLGNILDGIEVPEFKTLVADIERHGNELGWPCFLRTGQGSGKHDWKRCCFLRSSQDIASHVGALIEWSHLVDFLGLQHDVWVVRELLPTVIRFRCTRYNGFPLAREFRAFVEDGRVVYVNPYWPTEAIEQGAPDDPTWREQLNDIQGWSLSESVAIADMASAAGKAVGGRWSVDILETERGWYVTDMAEAERSYGFDADKFGPPQPLVKGE